MTRKTEFLTTGVDHVANALRPWDLAEVLPSEGVQSHVATVVHQTQILGANLLNIRNLTPGWLNVREGWNKNIWFFSRINLTDFFDNLSVKYP